MVIILFGYEGAFIVILIIAYLKIKYQDLP